METIGIMRIHDFPLTEAHAVPALADLVDGLCFLFNNAPAARMESLIAHPKCIAHAEYHKRFSIPGSFKAAFDLARPFNPKYLICFDEDELPPGRFEDEFRRFKHGNCMSLAFRDYICWGNPEMIIADRCYPSPLHCHAMKWDKNRELGRYKKADFFEFYHHNYVYKSDYPLRNLAFMTPELRERRFRRSQASISTRHWKRESSGPGAWARQSHDVMPYDPDLGWQAYCNREQECDAS